MSPYEIEIVGENQYGSRMNMSTVDHIFSIRKIFKKKWEYNNEVCQVFIANEINLAYQNSYIDQDLFTWNSKVRIGNHLSSSFPIEKS